MGAVLSDPPAAWTVTRSRIVHRDRWITLREDDCVTADGHVVAPYYVLDYPDLVVVVATDAAGDTILLDQYRHGLGIVSTELPGGAVEPADASPEAAGLRELREETGYVAGSAELLASLSPNPSNQSNRFHIVRVREARLEATPLDEPSERTVVRTMPTSSAWRLARTGGIVQAMHVAALAVAFCGEAAATI